jgi:hypothetical protein
MYRMIKHTDDTQGVMDSFRRRFSKSAPKDPWATDLSLEPEAEDVSELPGESTVLLTKVQPHPTSNDVDMKEYYRGLISAAIKHGGEHNGQRISIPWLRMTLAGLEDRPIPAEMMWEGVQDATAPDMPGFGRLFPAEGSAD